MAETLREILKRNELDVRAVDAKTTKYDDVVEVIRHGENKIAIPSAMPPEKAASTLKEWADSELQTVAVVEEIHGIPIDAAHALMLAVKHEYGIVSLTTKWSWFAGEIPPPFISVPTSVEGDNVDVYVGEFTLPGFEGARFMSYMDNENFKLIVRSTLRKKDQPFFKQLMDTARRFLHERSLYKGSAIVVDLEPPDEDEQNKTFIPEFMDVRSEKALILDRATEALIQATLWTPIMYTEEVRAMGTPVKRTILLYGVFGTGKTLTAFNTAKIAAQNNWTFLYVKDVMHLKSAIEFACKQFLPAVLFMEDTDKAFEDSAKINAIQNTMDGIDGKDRDLIIVLTSNHIEKLPQAILRPGRIDTAIHLKPADEDAAVRLVKLYAGDLLGKDADEAIIGSTLAGNIPATIREVVERSKLFALSRTGKRNTPINHEDVVFVTRGMQEHMALLNGSKQHPPSPMEVFGRAVGAEIADGVFAASKSLVNGEATAPGKLQ